MIGLPFLLTKPCHTLPRWTNRATTKCIDDCLNAELKSLTESDTFDGNLQDDGTGAINPDDVIRELKELLHTDAIDA